jgi:hypothetical protein
MFLIYGGKCLSRKRLTTGSRSYLKDVRKSQMRKWLRQHSEDFNYTGFDGLVKRWDKCVSVVEGCVEK